MQFTGYHGTSADNIDSINTNGYFLSGDDEWFGRGVYFFESFIGLSNGFEEARSWAIYVKKISNWAIFKAIMITDSYIDLFLDFEHKKLYDDIRLKAINLHKKSGKDERDFNENVIYKEMVKLDIDLIRALVDAKKDYGYYSYTVRRPQVQICVKNITCIKSNALLKAHWRP